MTAAGQYLASAEAYPRRKARLTKYRCHTGLLPHRVISYLVEMGPGIEKTTTICEDLGARSRDLVVTMRTAVRYRIVRKRLVGGVNYWCVPAGAKKEQSNASDGA